MRVGYRVALTTSNHQPLDTHTGTLIIHLYSSLLSFVSFSLPSLPRSSCSSPHRVLVEGRCLSPISLVAGCSTLRRQLLLFGGSLFLSGLPGLLLILALLLLFSALVRWEVPPLLPLPHTVITYSSPLSSRRGDRDREGDNNGWRCRIAPDWYSLY